MKTTTPVTIACFGEILWDILPAGELPGGAPMNVAYHLKQLGHEPALITRIGADARGKQLLRRLEAKQIDVSLIQTDPETPTGIVNAFRSPSGDMTYDIVAPAAWDNISLDEGVAHAAKNAAYFVYGSLVTRQAMSRETLLKLLPDTGKRVFDINLRAPFVDQAVIEQLLLYADILKMNEDELQIVSNWYGQAGGLKERALHLAARFNIDQIIVTQGANGCTALIDKEWVRQEGIKVTVADTIGSGDAFLAAYLSSLINGRNAADAIAFATRLGAFVATQQGAWPDYNAADI